MRMWAKLAGVLCLAVLVGGLSADDPKDKKGDDKKATEKKADDKLTDDKFVDKAGSASMAEVALGQIAEARAANPEVKEFARRMVKDHGKAHTDLLFVISDLRIAIVDKPLPEHQKHIDHFRGEVKDFDKEYMKMMVEGHGEAVKLFTQASKDLKAEALRKYAEKTLPTIKEHLEMAKKLNDKVGGGAAKSDSKKDKEPAKSDSKKDREPGKSDSKSRDKDKDKPKDRDKTDK